MKVNKELSVDAFTHTLDAVLSIFFLFFIHFLHRTREFFYFIHKFVDERTNETDKGITLECLLAVQS